jgi:hypothetical protein
MGEIAPEETRPVMMYPKGVNPEECRVRTPEVTTCNECNPAGLRNAKGRKGCTRPGI